MAQDALLQIDDQAINAAFMRNHRGEVCITFSDPAYVRADAIMIAKDDNSVHAIMQNRNFLISNVSEGMFRAFEENDRALLTAVKADGSVFELEAPIIKN